VARFVSSLVHSNVSAYNRDIVIDMQSNKINDKETKEIA
jgi:hypothetical protein